MPNRKLVFEKNVHGCVKLDIEETRSEKESGFCH